MTVLLLASLDGSALSENTAKAVAALRPLGEEIHVLVAGQRIGDAARAAAGIANVAKVLVADDATLAHQTPETLAALVVSLAEPYETLATAVTAIGRSTMPRVAALLDAPQISN